MGLRIYGDTNKFRCMCEENSIMEIFRVNVFRPIEEYLLIWNLLCHQRPNINRLETSRISVLRNSYVELNYRWPVEVPKIKTKTHGWDANPVQIHTNEIAIATPAVEKLHFPCTTILFGKNYFQFIFFNILAFRKYIIINTLDALKIWFRAFLYENV